MTTAIDSPDPSRYYGYELQSPQDHIFDEDDVEFGKVGCKTLDPEMLRDNARTSITSFLAIGFTATALLVLVIWFFLIGGVGDCKVDRLCDIRDKSASSSSGFSPKNFEFLVPTKLVWLGITLGTLCLLVASFHAFFTIRKSIGSPGMAEVTGRIQTACFRIISKEIVFMALLAVLLFILIGVGPGWRLAGAFVIGTLVSLVTCYAAVWISTSGNARTAAATGEGSHVGLKTGFRTGAIIGLVMASIAIIGVSSVYLMFEDVRALIGFATGASTVALFAMIFGAIFTNAANLAGTASTKNALHGASYTTKSIARLLSDNVSSIFGGNADCFESLVGSITATAILGSYLPFFHRDPFAMCVFNHLYVDNQCGTFGYPRKLSYASYICKSGDFYLQYPRLSVWQSNTAFVALPFLVAAVGVLASVVSTFFVRIPVEESSDTDVESQQETKKTRQLLWSMRMNRLLTTALVLVGLFVLFFILFGPASQFQKGTGLGSEEKLPSFELSSKPGACVNSFLTAESASSPAELLPKGQFSTKGRYTPLSTLGFEFGESRQTYWRLFLCSCIGVALGQLLYFLTEYFTDTSYSTIQKLASIAFYGPGAVMLEGIGKGMLSTALSMSLVLFSVFGAYNIFGFYGVALSSVSMLSTLGLTMSGLAHEPIMHNAARISELSRPLLKTEVFEDIRALQKLGDVSTASAKVFASSAAALTGYSILAALVHESELAPSPRGLVGSPRMLGEVLFNPSSMVDVYVVVSLLIGFMLPFLFAGQILLALSRASHVNSISFRENSPSAESNENDDKSFVHAVSNYALVETVLPAFIAIMAPLIVGFSFGQGALVGMLVAAIGGGYLITAMVSNSSGAWRNANTVILAWKNGPESMAANPLVEDSFRDTIGPALNTFIKMIAIVGLISAPLMEPDRKNGWIGALLLALSVIFICGFGLWSARFNKRSAENIGAGDSASSVIRAPPKKVSPFYVEGPTWRRDEIFPGSQMHDALVAQSEMESHVNMQVNTASLPGLSERSEMDLSRIKAEEVA